MADTRDWDSLSHRHKAISALFPYAVRQERDKEYAALDALLHAVKTSWTVQFSWRHIQPFLDKLFDGTSHVSSKRTLMLVSPYMPWGEQNFGEDRARIWAVAASAVPKEEEFAPSAINTLLQIACHGLLPSRLHGDAWSWLKLRPLLPPVCKGRNLGSCRQVVLAVRDLKDIEILKSYLLLVWSEWDYPYREDYLEMEDSIRRDFSGIEMNSHRADLLQRLDYILAELDRGLKHFQQYNPRFHRDRLQWGKTRYRGLRETLLEVDRAASEVPTRASSRLTTPFNYQLTHAATRRITLSVKIERRDGSQLDRCCTQRGMKLRIG